MHVALTIVLRVTLQCGWHHAVMPSLFLALPLSWFPSSSPIVFQSNKEPRFFFRQRYHYPHPRIIVTRAKLHDASISQFQPSPVVITNEQLAQRRLFVAKEKRLAREKAQRDRTDRHLNIKRFLSNQTAALLSNNNASLIMSSTRTRLISLKVVVNAELQSDLFRRLSGREKRGRAFVLDDSEAARSIRAFRQEIQTYFSIFKKHSYNLEASYPPFIESINETANRATRTASANKTRIISTWPIETDSHVIDLISKAKVFYQQHSNQFTRPTMVLHVVRNPNVPCPLPPPNYLKNMADPQASCNITMLSFYAFPPLGIDDPDDFAVKLRKLWKPFMVQGRVYVATEGVNAQMSVPTNVLPNFVQCCESIEEIGDFIDNGINVDPIPVPRHELPDMQVDESIVNQTMTGSFTDTKRQPFKNLHIRVKRQIVADGLSRSYDWQSAGYDCPPLEWHDRLAAMKQRREILGVKEANDEDRTLPILLDCRNAYETEIGTFQGAEPLQTENFRDSWKVLEQRLKDVPKNTAIMTFCTGGIRCVKVGAYLTQEMGFTNVSRLASGIIGYDRALKENQIDESMFKGTNFVFDGRLQRTITNDAMGTCYTCGVATSRFSNCQNESCNRRMIQCEKCHTSMLGTCSDACKQRVIKLATAPRRALQLARSHDDSIERTSEMSASPCKTLDEYSSEYSSHMSPVYNEMILNTRALIPSGSHMISGHTQGRFLSHLASMARDGRVLELGTFTGFATSCLLEGSANVAISNKQQKGSRAGGPYVMSLERDALAFTIATRQLHVIAENGFTEKSAEIMALLRGPVSAFPSEELDSMITLNYKNLVTCDLIRVNDALTVVEEMADGRGDLVASAFDLIFVDADKSRLLDYVDLFLRSDLLKQGGFIVVDNVLYKGLVLDAAGRNMPSIQENGEATDFERRRNRRSRKLASMMHRFNEAMIHDPRAEILVALIRDGLSIIRKR